MSDPAASTKPICCTECARPMDRPLCCSHCGALNPLVPEAFNYFEMFGLEPGYDLDERQLHRQYLSLSRTVHPDMVGGQSQDLRHRSLSLSAELNRAYETLRDPVSRAEYLLMLAGGPPAAQDKSVPGGLLGEVVMLREEIDDAHRTGNVASLQRMRQAIGTRRQAVLESIANLCRSLDGHDPCVRSNLRQQLNAFTYWDNLLEQLHAGGKSDG